MEKETVIAAIKAAGSNPCVVMYDEGFKEYCGLEGHFVLDGGDCLIAIAPNSGADPYPGMRATEAQFIIKYIKYDAVVSVEIFTSATSEELATIIPAEATAIYNTDTMDTIKTAIAKATSRNNRSPRGFNKEFQKEKYDGIYGKNDGPVEINLT